MKQFKSHVKWTKIQDSEDSHDTKEAAEAVCAFMESKWGKGHPPCEIRGNVMKTWTSGGLNKSIWE